MFITIDKFFYYVIYFLF